MTIGEKNFFETIENRIKEKGITVTKFIELAGISRSSYYETKMRNSNPKPLTRRAICQALDLNPETLKPIVLPKRSAWDEFPTDYLINECNAHWEWLDKYVEELKQIRAKD